MSDRGEQRQSFLLSRLLASLVIAGLLSGLLSCRKLEKAGGAGGVACKPSQNQPGPIEAIRIGAFKGEFAALVWLAETEGYFAKHGLNAQVSGFESGVAAVESLMTGNQDVATGADYVFVHMTLANHNGMSILAEIARSDSFAIVARNDRGISTPADLKEKRIALTGQTPAVYFLDRYLIYHHIDPKSVTIVNLPPAKLMEAIVQGSVDVAITWEPYVWHIRQTMGNKVQTWPAQAEQQFHFLLICNDAYADRHPEAIRKLIQALADAETLIRNDPARAQLALKQRLSFDEKYLSDTWSKHVIGLSLDQRLLVVMEDQSRWAIANKMVAAGKPHNYLKSIRREPLAAVRPESVTLY